MIASYETFNKLQLQKIMTNFGDLKKIKVCYFSTYLPNYTRTETLLQLLTDLKIKKIVIKENGALKYLKGLISLIQKKNDYDVILVSFRGQEILPLVKIISLIYQKPIIFDAFVSAYDTLCFDRKIFKPNSIIGKLLKEYDVFLCQISDVVLVDTKAHKEYFEKEFGAKNIDFIYVGCNKKMFKPMKVKKDDKRFIVFWYGTANPLQGVDVILKSAKLLEKENNIVFKIVGPVRKKYKALIEKLDLKNVKFVDWIPYERLPIEIARADLCLGGHFSNISKAKRVIAGKTFQFVSMEKPTIIGDCIANEELKNICNSKLLHFVTIGSPTDLSNKIKSLT